MAIGLYQAVIDCRYLHAKFLIENGVNIDSKNTLGETVIIGALRWMADPRKRMRMVKWLLHQGADIGVYDTKTQRDALTWAVYLNRSAEVKILLKKSEFDINFRQRDRYERTALHYAVLHNNEHIVLWLTKKLAKYDISVDIKDQFQITPYIMASELGYQGCAKILIELGEASPSQLQSTVFDYSHIWVGLEDWLDPRYAVIPSQPLDLDVLYNLVPQPKNTKAKVKFASASLDTITEYHNNVNESTDHYSIASKSKPKYRIKLPSVPSRKSPTNSRKSPTKAFSLPAESIPKTSISNGLSPEPIHYHSLSHTGHLRTSSVPQLPDISISNWITDTHYQRRIPCSGSFKKKTIPIIFELYAQQECQTFRPTAPKQSPREPEPVSKKLSPSASISLGALGKVTKFAAMIKMKRKHAAVGKGIKT